MGGINEVRLEPIVGREHLVRELFWSTLTIGEPLKFELNCAKQYENLSLDWYLSNGAAACAIAMIGDKPVGYCLVCTDHESFERSQKRLFVRLMLACVATLLSLRMNAKSRRFYWYRLKDSFTIMTTRKDLPRDVTLHAHLNVHHSHHDGSVSLKLRSHADWVCHQSGARGYFGEMNAVGGKRIVSLRRVGGAVVANSKNHTFSWLTGQDIHRLTLVRRLEQLETVETKTEQKAA
ncbi:MAG: hypothetical protein EBQ54_07330 [Actinobacteria bacterium]|nr:hypothetical protein [Actinomycetota bacterium]